MKENLVEELPLELATSLSSLTHLYLTKSVAPGTQGSGKAHQ